VGIRTLLLFALLGGPAQDEAAQRARALVEKLRSDAIDERQDAVEKLVEMGAPAMPALRAGAADPDEEVAGKAKYILQVLEIRQGLTPRLRHLMPGIEFRLAKYGDPAWTEAFLQATARDERGSSPFSELENRDLEGLAAVAVRGARGLDQKWAVCRHITRHRLRSAAPELVRLLSDPEGRTNAIVALSSIRAREAAPELLRLLGDPDVTVRRLSVTALGCVGAREAIGALGVRLRDPDDGIRRDAAEALAELGARALVPEIEPLLRDDKNWVREAAAAALCRLGSDDGVPLLIEASDRSDAVRLYSLNALREPELWRRLGELAVARGSEKSFRKILEHAASAGGLSLQVDLGDPGPRFLDAPPRQDAPEFVLALLMGEGILPPFDFILDPGRIRLVTPEASRAFWKSWWAVRERK
jgi:HEAT repeat protein